MSMTFEIDVVQKDGKNLFCYTEAGKDGVSFEQLPAYHEFCDGSVSIVRNGETITKTVVSISGPRNEEPYFTDLARAFTRDKGSQYDDSALFAHRAFKAGDKIVMELPWNEGASLRDFLIHHHFLKQAHARASQKRTPPYKMNQGYYRDVNTNYKQLAAAPLPTVLGLQ